MWTWSTFPEYLDAVDAARKGLNYASTIGHSALRTWAMGERAFEETATEDDLALMADQLRAALHSGAVGFTTSRSAAHATSDDRPVASRLASWDEVARARRRPPSGGQRRRSNSRQSDAGDPEMLADYILASATWQSRAVCRSPSATTPRISSPSRRCGYIEETVALGGGLRPLTHCRASLGSAQSFLTKLAFDCLPEWREIRRRPLREQAVLLRDPDVRRHLVHAAHHGHYDPAFGVEAVRPRFGSMEIVLSPYLPNPIVADEAAGAASTRSRP